MPLSIPRGFSTPSRGFVNFPPLIMAKSKTPVGNMVIAQSGGPTMVINQSLIGAVLEAKKHRQIKNIYGSLHGIAGILG